MSVRFLIKLATVASTCWFGISDALAENRIALVIGNSNYTSVAPLPNPAHDANAIAKFLTAAGFQVVQAPNLTQGEMRRTIGTFASLVSEKGPDTVALVFYAGHGLQVDGENFLVPVDAEIEREGDVQLQAVRLADLMKALSSVPTKSRIVILDACRNNPFSAINKTAGPGLAIVDAPNGSIVAYSTAPGTEALDGNGEHSPYTSALLGIGQEPGLPIEQLLKRVRLQVSNATHRQQFPWESSSLTAEFSFFPTETEPQQVASNREPRSSVAPRSRTRSIESWHKELRSKAPRQAYDMVVLEDTLEAYQAYLDLYPWDLQAQTVSTLFDRRKLMLAWYEAVTANTVASYQAFLATHANSALATTANRLITKIGPNPKPAWAGERKMNAGPSHVNIQGFHQKTSFRASSGANKSFTTRVARWAKNVKPQNSAANGNKVWKVTTARAQSFGQPAHTGGSEMMHMSAGHMGGGRR